MKDVKWRNDLMEVARYWRTTAQRYRLMGEVDSKTGQRHITERGGRVAEPAQMSGRGEVFSFTTIHVPPAGFGKYAPYMVALIRLEEGPLLTAQLTDVEEQDVRIGMKVEMVTRVLREDGNDGDGEGRGMLVYGYKFRPAWGVRNDAPKAQRIDAIKSEPKAVNGNGNGNGNGHMNGHANGNGYAKPALEPVTVNRSGQ